MLLRRNVTKNNIKLYLIYILIINISEKITLLDKLKGKIYYVAHF